MKKTVIAVLLITITICLAVLAAPSPEKRTNNPAITNLYINGKPATEASAKATGLLTEEPPEPTVLKSVADSQASMAHNQGFQEGFRAGVAAAEKVRLDEQLDERVAKAVAKNNQGK